MRRGVPAQRLPQRLDTRVVCAVLYAPLVAKFALAFCLCLGLLVSYAARSAEFCSAHRALYDPYTTLRCAPEPSRAPCGARTSHFSQPVCHRGSLPHCPNGRRGHDTLREGARCQWEAAPEPRTISIHCSGCERGVGLIESSGESWAQKLHHADTALSRPAQGCFSSALKRMKRRPSCRPRRLPLYW